MEQQKSPEGSMEAKEPKGRSAWSGRKIDPIMLLFPVAVIVLVVLAAVSYSMYKSGEEDTNLAVEVHPDTDGIAAGSTISIWANTTWNGESIDDSSDVLYLWQVNNSALGSFSSIAQRVTTFTAGRVAGDGLITCDVTYVVDEISYTSNTSVQLTINPPTLASVSVVPSAITLVYDRVQVFNSSAIDSLGDPVPGLIYSWTLQGIPTGNYTLNSTTGPSVNLTANITGTAWLNVTATYNGVAKNASAVIPIIPAAPTMTIGRTNLPGGVGIKWTCSEPTGALSWDNVTVHLTDGTEMVNWSLEVGGLSGGMANTTEFGPMTLGSLTVFLNVTDLAGNGLTNLTDYFTFTTSGGKFNPARDYTVTLIYKPTLDVIVQSPFRG
jgi:hypothetical protein